MKRAIIAVVLLIFIFLAAYLIYFGGGDQVIIERGSYSTAYYLRDIPIKLEVYHRGDKGVWRLGPRSAWARSDQPIVSQVAVMEKLLKKALSDQPSPPRALSMGRLEESFGNNNELSKRLSLAAKTSPLWASFAARMKSHLWDATTDPGNKEVAMILNDNHVYRELIDMFKRHGLIIKVKYVEKVLINKDKLPFDCQVWFSVTQKK